MKFKALRLFVIRVKNLFHRFAGKKIPHEKSASWSIWAEFTTIVRDRPELGAQNTQRIHNMRLSCDVLDGVLIAPGECFSMMKWIGEANADKGYLEGPMLVRGALSSDFGGGLCQISTTVFNTALTAGMTIIEKHNHSTDIWGNARMVELGRDATYVFARKDLIFKNKTVHPVCLRIGLGAGNTTLTARILSTGGQVAGQQIATRVIREIPCRLKHTGTPRSGWVTETIRRTDGRVTFRKRERYKPVLVLQGDKNE